MIVDALSSVGSYADIWSHLKSMDHALERALAEPLPDLGSLDKERLQALSVFLRDSLEQGPADPAVAIDSLLATASSGPSYSPDFDLQERIRSIPAFAKWQSSSRRGFQSKLERLLEAVDRFTGPEDAMLFGADLPREEFEVLRAILEVMLSEIQSGMTP